MLNDLRYALRQLRKSPGFALTAVLTLALGIGATTAIFTLVYDVLLRPLPFAHANRIVVVQEKVAEWRAMYPVPPVSANHFTFWQQHSRSFAAMAAMESFPMPLGGEGRPLQVNVLSSTPGVFPVLEVWPQLGRAFTQAEAQPGHDHVVILSHSLWRDQFAADPAIVGRTIRLNGYPYTVLGVMPASFHMPAVWSPSPIGAIVPLAFDKDELSEAMGDLNYFSLARLRPGVSLAAARAELDAEQHTIQLSLPADEESTLSAWLMPWQQEYVGDNRQPLLLLLAAVAALLLVGCVNIANLLLARAVGQRAQMAVAAALGAGRFQMLRMAIREPAALAALGCGFGVALAAWVVPAMQRYLPSTLNFRGPLHLDAMGAGCALLLAGVTTVLAGGAPAWMVSQTDPHEVLHAESRLAGESRLSRRFRRALVAVEVAASVALVLVTGLLTASVVRLMRVNRGYDVDHTLTARVELPRGTYTDTQDRAEFYRRVLAKLRALPGVEYAAGSMQLPLDGEGWGDSARVQGDSRPWTQLPNENWRWISPGYFQTLRISVVAGRSFTASDWGQNVALVSERTAKKLWPGQNPIGRQFSRAAAEGEKPFTVIGIVANARTVSLAKPDPPLIYVPYWFRCNAEGGLLLRTRQDPSMMAGLLRKTIWSVDPGVPALEVTMLGAKVADSIASRRFEMDLLLLFAASALLLAGLGVCGVVTYSVVQRRREIGLRLALGARRESIYGLVVREGMMPVAAGAVAGVALAFGMARLLQNLLFGVSPYNPVIATVTVGLLLAVGAVACLLPARRAAHVEPMEALRNE